MDKEEQIKWLEDLAEDILEQYTNGYSRVDKEMLAVALYNIGCRKQSVDTVEVVRCKDCVYFKQSVSALFPHATAFICDFPYGLQKNVNENDFCCHGAKMKGGVE